MHYLRKTAAATAVVVALGVSAPLYAGNNDGSLAGQVITLTKQPIANAKITLQSAETGFTRTITADDDGNYRFGRLPVGVYELTVTKDGFEPVEVETLNVNIGSNSATIPMYEVGVETIEVRGNRVAVVDVSSSETGLNIGEATIDKIPVPRTLTSVALLAPGTTRGDSRFGGASFGGASVAENAVYINGLNVTNFRTGVGFSSVPFEFYEEFQVKTGGYSAEFGRSTGGVINAVTKRGTNEFHFGGNIYWQPDSLRQDSPNSYRTDGSGVYIDNSGDVNDDIEGNIYASGPIIKDKLFFYALYNPRDNANEFYGTRGETFVDRSSDDAFWGLKLDWQITEDHLLEYLTFSDERDVVDKTYARNAETGEIASSYTTSASNLGGDNFSVKYTGYWTDDLTGSMLYGEDESNEVTTTDASACNLVYDRRDDKPLGVTSVGCASASDYFLEAGKDEREAFRVDIEYALGSHLFRLGYDSETNTSTANTRYSGEGEGGYWMLYDTTPGASLSGDVVVPDGVDEYARLRVLAGGGQFEVESHALYAEDIWNVTDDVTLSLGLRWDSFENKNAEGNTFIKIDDMFAPRLGVSWDIHGDGESKLFMNVGRYYLPVASNTNIRLAGGESDRYEFYQLNGNGLVAGPNGGYVPDLGEQFGTYIVNDGSVPDTSAIVDQEVDPMYQDEIIAGYQASLNENWRWGITGIRRVLEGALDDMIIDHALKAKFGCGGSSHTYVLGNPGKDMTVNVDSDCDGKLDGLTTFSADELGYPEAERTYYAVSLDIERAWDDVWMLSASYTWSHSYGNSEGLVKSDNGQDDAGMTSDFDFPELMDGAYGNLANDRRHMFKAFGAYAITENLTASANLSIESGRPRNKFGNSYPGIGELDYGEGYYSCTANCGDLDNATFEFNPRGTAGETDWVTRLDLGLAYTARVSELDLKLRADVYNVLGSDHVRRYGENYEDGIGEVDPTYGIATSWQTPRYVQFSLSFDY